MTSMKRRDFLKTLTYAGASSLIPSAANAFSAGGPVYRRGWRPMSLANNLGTRSHLPVCTFGSKMFLFGGAINGSSNSALHAWYDPEVNIWTRINTTTGTIPAARSKLETATDGSTIFVWGGASTVARLNTGGCFTPSGATGGNWVVSPTSGGCPSAREQMRISTLGSQYFVWGGKNGTTYYNDGAIYNPGTNLWTAVPVSGSPTIAVRSYHAQVSTGSKIIIWGGFNSGGNLGDGFIYDSGTWSAIASSPMSGRPLVGSCWTGSKMFIWGAGSVEAALYDPVADSWFSCSNTNAPVGAGGCYAFWNGSKVIAVSDGETAGIYDPNTDQWLSIPFSGPLMNASSYAIGYANKRLLIWGGLLDSGGGVRTDVGYTFYRPDL